MTIPTAFSVIVSAVCAQEVDVPRYRTSDSDFFREWLVCGPFQLGAPGDATNLEHLPGFEEDFLRETGGEAEAQPDAGDQVTAGFATLEWFPHHSEQDSVFLDEIVSPAEGLAAYAYCEIESDSEKTVALALGSNDGARVWLNGEVIWDVTSGRSLQPDADVVPVVLRRGVNRLLLKIEERGNLWGLACRLLPLSDQRVLDRVRVLRIAHDEGMAPYVEFVSNLARHPFPSAQGSWRVLAEADENQVLAEGRWTGEPKLELPVDTARYGEYVLEARYTLEGETFATLKLPFTAGVRSEYVLFHDRRTDYSIVVHPNASESEKWAAQELKNTLESISGASFMVREAVPGAAAIYVGFGPFLEALSPNSMAAPESFDESFQYRNFGPNVAIWGGSERGTMYGVMSFLEREFGCRWYTPDVTVLPKRDRFAFTFLNHGEQPGLRVRNDFYYEAFDPVWAARNRSNGAMTIREQPGGVEGYWAVHTFYPLMPPEEFYGEHPEYYSLIDGERIYDHAQLCLTNPEVFNIIVERLKKIMREQPDYLIYSISQNDWRNPCQCDNCQAIATAEQSESGPVLWFVNGVAEAVEAEFPDKFVGTLAYQYTRKPPKNLQPRRNVVIRLCSIECCFAHDFVSCPENQEFLSDLRGWAAIAPQLYIWDYVVNFSHYVMPYPNFRVLQSNLRTFRANRAIGVMEQAAYQSRGGEFAELRAYLLSKLLWNPDAEVDPIIDDFMYGYYGRAGQYVRAYFDLLHGLITPDTHIHLGLEADDKIFTDAFVRQAERLFDQAETVADSPDILRRVSMARLPLMYLKCRRSPELAVSDGTYARFTEIATREGVLHYAESGAPHREEFHALMDAYERDASN